MQDVEYKKKVEEEMEAALSNGEFHIFLQPKINMITSKVYGAEALSRWIHPKDGLRTPDMYIPIFEENGFIFKLDMYMFEELCKLKAKWYAEKVEFANIPISINMSRPHLMRSDFVDEIVALTQRYGVNPAEIDIEITENMYIKDHTALIEAVGKMQANGFYVSIDDFGAGYSALNMLKDIPVNTIKIDKEFLHLSANSERGKKVIKNIILLCKDLRFNVMVEGVETLEQLQFLVGYGCEIAQGFYYSKPITVREFEEYTKAHYVVTVDIVKFTFNDTLKSEDGRYKAECIGSNWEFSDGVIPGTKALHFKGGRHNENGMSLATDIIHNDSYSISMWLKVDRAILWSAAIFGEYENGFFQFCPLAENEQSCFRIRDRRIVDGWFDSVSEPLKENEWYHVTLSYHRLSGKASLYINGELKSYCVDVEALYFLKRLFIGSDIYKDSFEGSICEIVFYDRSLEPDDVKDIYEEYIRKME